MTAEAVKGVMQVCTIVDVRPTSDRRDPRYKITNDPELNIQWVADQEARIVNVEKKPEDFDRLIGLLFNKLPIEIRPPYSLPDTPLNRALVTMYWDAWSVDGAPIFTSGAASTLMNNLGIDFNRSYGSQLSEIQVDHLKRHAHDVEESMNDAFMNIYRHDQATSNK